MALPENPKIYIETGRLFIRQYRESDKALMREMQCDPGWMKNFPFTRTPDESDALVEKFAAEVEREGFSFFALEDRETGEFAGYTGLHIPDWGPSFGPCVEIGWGIRNKFSGQGLVTEAAGACLVFARDQLKLPEVYSFTTPKNAKSIAVMERIGMTRVEGGDFMHPRVDPESPFARHVLYRIRF